MTDPARVGELLPGVLAEVVDRAGHGYDRWAELVAQAGYCHHPVRLAGRVEHADRQTGEVRTSTTQTREPDGVLLKACGTRRESRCPSCAAIYRADAYQLLAAGLKGGKGVPETVAEHPRLFVTFTAPSLRPGPFPQGPRAAGVALPPLPAGCPCPHGRRDGCWQRHDPDDPRLGEPLCARCYDSRAPRCCGTPWPPELWRGPPSLCSVPWARLVGLQEGELRRLVRISYAKVAEFQRRGAIHFHAVIRLDAATDCRCPAAWPRHPNRLHGRLARGGRSGRRSQPSGCPARPWTTGRIGTPGGASSSTCATSPRDDQAGELSAEQVAGYIAKYATKATESFGAGLDRRIGADDLERLDGLPAHVAELVRAAWELGGRPSWHGLRLRAWAHMLGFGGHWSTKSRRYSTTMGALRRARVAFAKRRRAEDGVPLDAWGRPEDDQAVIVVASWAYVGAGYATEGERWLALSAAARAREHRRIAREELTTTTAIRCMTLRTPREAPELDTLLICRAGRRAAGYLRAVRAPAGVRAPHRLRQARPPRPHRRPRPGRLHRRRPGRRGRAALAETGSLTMAHIEKRMRGGRAELPGALPRPGRHRAQQDVPAQGRRREVPGDGGECQAPGCLDGPGGWPDHVRGLAGGVVGERG